MARLINQSWWARVRSAYGPFSVLILLGAGFCYSGAVAMFGFALWCAVYFVLTGEALMSDCYMRSLFAVIVGVVFVMGYTWLRELEERW